MKVFGLIGYPLTHSFSKKYFTEKFENLGISDSYSYKLFSIQEHSEIQNLIANHPNLAGLNVTIPHKLNVIQYLDAIDPAAEKIGAVNVIKFENGKLVGYNSDYYGFKQSLSQFLVSSNQKPQQIEALVLGIGGAAKAVLLALEDLGINYLKVSRTKSEDTISYQELPQYILSHKLIINCSPVGTFPNADECPEIPYQDLDESYFLYDLVYNPAETLFMKKGLEKGAKVINGYEMLVLQAEKAWEIWNK